MKKEQPRTQPELRATVFEGIYIIVPWNKTPK
jgi:hypothetical protein